MLILFFSAYCSICRDPAAMSLPQQNKAKHLIKEIKVHKIKTGISFAAL